MLKGKTAVITGAARGIGQEIALMLAKNGADIAVIDLNADWCADTASKIKETGGNVLTFGADVSNPETAENIAKEISEKWGKIDILVNNAGITKDNLVMRMKIEDWDAVLNVNLKGAFNYTKAVSKYMFKARYGRIINISSVVGVMGNAGQANYAASKAGMIGLTKACAKEFASRNINVNAIAPGYIKTAMTDALNEEQKNKLVAFIPAGRLGLGEDVAKGVLFLASDLSDYITGQVIHIDGGMVM